MQSSLPFINLATQYCALKERIHERMQRVLEHGQYIMGPEVVELEEQLCLFTNAQYCITVGSGTQALLISLMALGIGPGDEVITTPFTFAATAEVIALLGAKPVFVDIEPSTCLLDAQRLETAITCRTRAIIPVSLYGQVANMAEINAVARRHTLAVIEDGAQSFGATYQGQRSGNLSTLGCTSFFPSKPLGCYGDGGAIFTNDTALAQACRDIRVHGQSARYTHTRIGLCGRMDTLQCAVVLAKLERFEWELERRRVLGRRYCLALEGTPGLKLLSVPVDRDCVWAQFTVFVAQRAQVQAALSAQSIPTAIHYPRPLHHQNAYSAYCCPECCPHSLWASEHVLSLPMGPDLQAHQQDRVVQALRQVLTELALL
jgi:UDP-2-acetamido-2-deoxy-ribo-hexuluronate aminotransferase